MTPEHFYQGKEIMVFDNKLWDANGGDSDFDPFFRKATILRVYVNADRTKTLEEQSPMEMLLDVRFEHDGRISKGHFANMTEEIPYEAK